MKRMQRILSALLVILLLPLTGIAAACMRHFCGAHGSRVRLCLS